MFESSLRAILIKGTTGRKIDTAHPAFGPAQTLVGQLETGTITLDDACSGDFAQRLLRQLAALRSVGLSGEYFRGRRYEGATPDFGAPPDPTVRRYGEGEERTWYISPSARVVVHEMPQRPLIVGRLRLHAPSIPIARLTDVGVEHSPELVAYLMGCENIEDVAGQRDAQLVYRPTHLVARMCAQAGIGALEYPSVRAGYLDDPTATNIVIFGRFIADARFDVLSTEVVTDHTPSPLNSGASSPS